MLSNDTSFNILTSFAYLAKSKGMIDMFTSASREGTINTMIDSGAFTLYNNASKSFINVDSYCKFIEQYGRYSEKYVMLDVINNHNQSKENYETMLSRGLNPMYVLTLLDNDYEYLKQAVGNNKHLCVAGGVTHRGEWMYKRFQDVYKKTGALIHGLGFVKHPQIYQLPLHSVDSASWTLSGQLYGQITALGADGRTVSINQRNKYKIPKEIRLVLDTYKITPKQYANPELHKGNSSIGAFTNMVAHLEKQKYAKRKGLKYFMAAANTDQLGNLLWINNQIEKGTLTYDKYYAYKRNCSPASI